jgi:hypothetical protein
VLLECGMKEMKLLSIIAITAFLFPTLTRAPVGIILVQNGQYSGQYSGRYSGQYSGQWSGQYSGRYNGQYSGQSASRGGASTGGAPVNPADLSPPVNTGSCGELHSSPDTGLTDNQGRQC